MKKVISVILAVVMTFSLFIPSFAAAEDTAQYPILYLEGQGYPLYNEAGEKIYGLDVDWISYLTQGDNIQTLLKDIALMDYDKYAEDLYNLIAPVYENVILDENGEASDGSGLKWDRFAKSIYTKKNPAGKCLEFVTMPETLPGTNGSFPVYRAHFDWRLSPITLAQDVHEAIDVILAKTGASKVNLVSRCLATNIAAAYMSMYGDECKVNECVYYAAAIDGIGLLNAMFTGNIKIDPQSLDCFATYFTSLEGNGALLGDDSTTELVVALLTLIYNVEQLGYGMNVIQKLFDAIQEVALPKITKACYATFPSYWSMTSADHIQKGLEFTFDTEESKSTYAGLIEKINNYYDLQVNFHDTFAEQQINGIASYSVIAKYGFPLIPLSSDAREESDVFVTTNKMSLGATCADSNGVLSDSYIATVENKAYVSVDKKIDASTCLFPERTWFVKGLEHKAFPDCVNDLIIMICNSNGTMTVNTDENYTQFLQYEGTGSSDGAKGTLTPIITMDDTTDTTDGYIRNSPLRALFNFITKLINFFTNLLNKK
ncbi:MAG: hypothetical protein ACI4GC_06500 [Acutalibacteraceae bacterium]